MVEHADQTQAFSSTQVDHVMECLEVVEDYRGQRISKWDTIAQVSTAILSAAASMNSEQHSAAGKMFLAMLNKHDWTLANAHICRQQGLG